MGRRKYWWALQTALGVGGLVALLLFVNPARAWNSLSKVSIGYLLLGYVWQLLAKLVWTWRWRAVLSIGGIRRSYWNLLALVHVGLFFNTFLPSGAGGDVVRGWYTSRSRDGRFAGYVSVLFERALGLITLALLAALASALELMRGRQVLPRGLLLGVFFAGAAIALAGLSTFVVGARLRTRIDALLLRAPPRLRRGLPQAVEAWQGPDCPRALIFVSSMALQLIAVFWYIATARAVHLDTPAVVFFLLMPVSAIVSMLPVSPGGAGIREWTLVGLLSAYGVASDQAAAFALLAFMMTSTFALIGGVIYPFYRVPPEVVLDRAATSDATDSTRTTARGR